MDIASFVQHGPCEWRLAPTGRMSVPVVIYATEALLRDMDEKVREQAVSVACLPGIVRASCVMPDGHWGYGFPIGGVAAFDAARGGVVSAGGVGFDVSCGVRCLHTGLTRDDVVPVQARLAEALCSHVPPGMGSRGAIHLNHKQMHDMLAGGARWAVEHGWGTAADLERIEAAPAHGLTLPGRELACAPLSSELGEQYLGAMRAAINCALANRQILTHLVRQVFARHVPKAQLPLLYDVSHNTCKLEQHRVDGELRELYVHRKGATRAFGPGHPELPEPLRSAGQPVLIGGSMGTAPYVLAGTRESEALAFSSACHGAGRAMSRHEALKHRHGRQVVDDLAARGILVKCTSSRGIAEEAPGAYKDVAAVVDAAAEAGLARKVARLQPLICVKG